MEATRPGASIGILAGDAIHATNGSDAFTTYRRTREARLATTGSGTARPETISKALNTHCHPDEGGISSSDAATYEIPRPSGRQSWRGQFQDGDRVDRHFPGGPV